MLWLMAGLAIAALNLTERAGPSLHRPSRWGQARRVAMATPRPTERSARPVNEVSAARAIHAVARWMGILAAWPRSFRRPVRRLLSRVLPGVMAVGLLGLVVVSPSSVAASAEADVQLVFSATERSTGQTGIYVAGSDRRPRRLTPADGRFYSWPEFAPGSRRIVYTARSGPPGSPTSIYEVSADGGPPTLIRSFEFEVAQPKISPDGTVLLFSATAPWFRLVGLYSMDLATGDVTNLSTVTQPNGASDADPVFSADGESIVFADNKYDSTQIARLARDGTSRKLLTSDRYYNVDPDLSGDEARIAYSSYRGTGGPFTRAGDQLSVKVEGWQLVSSPVAGTGSVLALTQGQNCTVRDPSIRCSPAETSAFRPRYSPDGDSIGFVGALDSLSNCICAIGTDGRDPQVVLESVDLAIDWFDWAPDRAASAPRPLPPPAPQPFDRALLVVQGNDDTTQVVSASPDFLDQHELPLPPGYDALVARWGRNDEVIFSARADLGVAAAVPHPAPPMGAQRRTHFTFDQLDPGWKSEDHQVDIAEQLFLRRADGTVERLTDPYTEDWRDGLPDGDARSNGQPRVSPDGSTVLYTSTSRLTGESFVMSLSLRTGEVLNLTNGTSGAALVDDQHPSLSADGRRLAFTFTDGWNDVWAMDATTGFNADPITDDEWTDSSPVFTVDGASVVYSSYRGSGSGVTVDADGSVKVRPQGWVLVRRDLNSNTETLLSGSSQPSALQPEVDPSGMWVYFLSLTPTGPRIARVPRDGTAAPSIVTGDTRAHRSVDLR